MRAIDAAGHVDPTPDSFDWNVDTLAPTTTILSGPEGVGADKTPSFTFEASSLPASFER